MIEIGKGISIREDELIFKLSRSSGPGGQNVNKVNTRVTLFFDVANCNIFSDLQKQRILKWCDTRCFAKVPYSEGKSQRCNRAITPVIERFAENPPCTQKNKSPEVCSTATAWGEKATRPAKKTESEKELLDSRFWILDSRRVSSIQNDFYLRFLRRTNRKTTKAVTITITSTSPWPKSTPSIVIISPSLTEDRRQRKD